MSDQLDNIFAGTQVVALVDVRGTNNSLVHPRGAVGVVTPTPAGAEEKYLEFLSNPDAETCTSSIPETNEIPNPLPKSRL